MQLANARSLPYPAINNAKDAKVVPRTLFPAAGSAAPAAAAADGWLFLSGCTPGDADGRCIGGGDVGAQTDQTLRNMAAALAAAGGTMADVLKCNVYLADIRHFQAMNDAFAKHFPNDPPARTTVEARLSDPARLVEIEAVAFLGRG